MKTLEFETETMSTFSAIINEYVVEDEKCMILSLTYTQTITI